MEVGMAWLSSPISFPSRTRLKNCIPSSVLMFQAQTIHLVHCHPMREEHNPPLNTSKEDGRSQEALDRKEMEMETSFYKEESDESYQFARKFEHQLSNKPVFWNMVPPSPTQETGYTYMTVQSSNASRLSDVEPVVSINIAKKASVASKEVALITKNSTNLDSVSSGADYRSSSNFALHEKNIVVRSTRHLERRSKFRGVSKTTAIVPEPHNSKRINRRRKKRKSHGSNSNDPVQFFLGGQATTQLLTPDEESELVIHWKNLRKLETVKSKLQSSLGREPTMSEWAQNAGVSRPVLQTQVVSGVRSRQKLITASLRMVVHIAKQYQVQGLSLQDLIQAGTVGLLTSFEKFKPRMGCRFGTYAFWWIRHSVQRAVCHHSRIIRLPEHVHYQLSQIEGARIACLQEGNYNPTWEELARRTGLSVHKLETILFESRAPISLQGRAWDPDSACYYIIQDSIEDTEHETPEVSFEKEMMRQHIRRILNTLEPRERDVIVLRFGIEDGHPKPLSEVGAIFGLSKQLIWKLENRAMAVLRGCIDEQGLEAYVHLVV